MKRFLCGFAIVILMLASVSCDQILSFFDKQVNALAGGIEGIEMNEIKVGGLDKNMTVTDLKSMMDDNGIESGSGEVYADYSGTVMGAETQSDARLSSKDDEEFTVESFDDLRYTDSVLCVYFYETENEEYLAKYKAFAENHGLCKFYASQKASLPAKWAQEVNEHKNTSAIATGMAARVDEANKKWKVVVKDISGDTTGDVFYILSNSRILSQINGRVNDIENADNVLDSEIKTAEQMLSYRLKAKKMHWGAGYSIEDYMHEIKSGKNDDGTIMPADDVFMSEIKFEVEQAAAAQKDKSFGGPYISFVLMYRAFPLPVAGEFGSYRTEDIMMSVLNKKGSNVNHDFSPYDFNFIQEYPNVKFIKCNAFGSYAGSDEDHTEASSKGCLLAAGKLLKRDYKSYCTRNEDTDVGYAWLVKEIERVYVTEGNGQLSEYFEYENGVPNRDSKGRYVLKDELSRSMCILVNKGRLVAVISDPTNVWGGGITYDDFNKPATEQASIRWWLDNLLKLEQ